ncbi:putative LPS assembly protein LptD [Pedobacter nutrimenti]|uniref:LPS-assembly protein LptD central domain-containing protein n=1 Tax=Pedobacter nutrimenti TaxID=1241337 RepID=A0A318UMW7_9SPHI|nr:putative LPS assembly protein LptD [Pedobacter nutrimenti]PYF76777.1 hypothetical protein B0O44_101250 [Pedobacter nutrimenti]
MKLLRNIILLKSFLLLSAIGNYAVAFSGFSAFQVPQKQDTLKRDTTKNKAKKDAELDSKVEYKAQDSTKYSKDRSIIYLYGKARVIYQSFELDADYIRYDSKTNVIFASGRKDAKGHYIGKPIFKMEKDGSSVADSLFYNTKTGKGTVFNAFTEQQGSFFSGGQSKKQPDNEVHVKNMIYSTCNLPHPHFGFFITKGIVTERQVITGPVYLEIEDIPLPLALPFAFFPKPNKKSSGVILPSPGEDANQGFFLRDGGYYLGISDNWDAKLLGTIYTKGSYSLSGASNYLKRYKYGGNILLTYTSTKSGVEGTLENRPRKDFNITWNHSQNPNAHPGSTFSASVNAGTSSFYQNSVATTNYNPNAISTNVLRSSISYSKTMGIFNLSTNVGASQETQSKTVSLTLPQINLSMTSINPFDSKNRVGEQKWYQKFNLGYNMDATNSVSTREDLLFGKGGLKRFQNGFNHNLTGSLPFNVAKYFNFTVSANYNEQWHFQTLRQTALRILNRPDSIVYDTISGFKRSGEYNLNLGLTTKIYNTLQFKKGGKIQAIRHVMTPNIGFSYKPDFSTFSKGYYKPLLYQDGTPVWDPSFNAPKKYSIFQNTRYTGPGQGQTAAINFGLTNDVELKVLSSKDTTGTGTKKIPIIQGLNINSGYNFLLPAYKLADFSFSGRSQFTEKIGINFSGSLTPYDTKTVPDSITHIGNTKVLIDRYVWQNGKLPRLTAFGFSFDYSFNPASFKKRQDNLDKMQNGVAKQGLSPEQAAELAAISRDPNAFVDFNIPWNFAFAYSFQYSADRTGLNGRTYNTLTFNGDFNATPKWKVQFNSGYNFETKNLALTTFSIYRDLHCWDMSFQWVPFGTYRMYSMTLRVKASILQDLKLSKQASSNSRF